MASLTGPKQAGFESQRDYVAEQRKLDEELEADQLKWEQWAQTEEGLLAILKDPENNLSPKVQRQRTYQRILDQLKRK